MVGANESDWSIFLVGSPGGTEIPKLDFFNIHKKAGTPF